MRSLAFSQRQENRYWWFSITKAEYVPPVFAALTDEEWRIMEEWYADTDIRFKGGTGECNIPPITFLFGLIGGSNIKRIVQLGHYIGFSTLLIGFQLRKMGREHRLCSFDIDPKATAYTASWIKRAALADRIELAVSDSTAPNAPQVATKYLGGAPQLIFLDSSHRYSHTLSELDLWYEHLAPGGLLVMHDASQYASRFDADNEGGVLAALKEWSTQRGVPYFALNESVTGAPNEPRPVYQDGCGLGLVQRAVRVPATGTETEIR